VDCPGVCEVRRSGPAKSVPFRLSVRTGDGVDTRWLILPDRELERPFRSFIRAACSGESGLSEGQKGALRALPHLPKIDVYAARWCENSAAALAAAGAVAVARPGLAVRVMDVESFERSLLPVALSVVPLCVIGGKGRLYGACGAEELVLALEAFSSGRWARQTLLGMLDRRMRTEILELVRAGHIPAEEIGRLVGESSLPVRMGAILVLADLAKVDRGAAGEAVPALLELLGAPDAQTRADAIYALGEIRDLRSLPYIEKCKHDQDRDVAECAREAVEAVRAFNILRH
jgi:hypothetical protein